MLETYITRGLGNEARQLIAALPADLLARTATFLLLKDSRSSFQIEGEDPPQHRMQRWGQVIGEAGQRPIDRTQLERLQRIVIGDARFVHLGLRVEGGFIGEPDRLTGAPIPEHVSARHPGSHRCLSNCIGKLFTPPLALYSLAINRPWQCHGAESNRRLLSLLRRNAACRIPV